MSRICLTVEVKLMSDAIFSSGYSVPGGEDIAVKCTPDGKPIISGSTMKGLLRECMQDLLVWTGGEQADIDALFGTACAENSTSRRLIFSDWTVDEEHTALPQEQWFSKRTFTALEEQVVKQGSLRMASCLNHGIVFVGKIFCDSKDKALMKETIPFLKQAGLLRNRGFGAVRTSIRSAEPLKNNCKVTSAGLLKYRLKLLTPLAVSSVSKNTSSKNYFETRNYIVGTTVRGMVLSQLANLQPKDFEMHKSVLFSDKTRFSGAYPVMEEHTAVPTPMGFYGDKTGDAFYSVLHEDVHAGHKRAKMGAFCMQKDTQLVTYSPQTDSQMRIQRGTQDTEQNVFTSRVLNAGTQWEGYIRLDEPELASVIAKAFTDTVSLGAGHYAGRGLCEVVSLEAVEQPNWSVPTYSDTDDIPNTLYMLLLSPTAVKQDGIRVGISEAELSELLGTEVTIEKCASSVTEIDTFNRTWKCYAPSEIMYEKGSLFQLTCTPAPTAQAVKQLEAHGIGIRRAEGFGQVLFLKDFDRIQSCFKEDSSDMTHDTEPEAKTQRQKRCKWLLETEIDTGEKGYQLSNSQIGSIQEWVQTAIANKEDRTGLDRAFEHNMAERSPDYRRRFEKVKKQIDAVLNDAEYAAYLPEDTPIERLRLISDWIDLSRRKEK